MKKEPNYFMSFFSSVRLTIFTLFILAFTSIIGTIIPQDKPPEFYIEKFGGSLAKFMEILSIPTMYTSWWFLFFLVLLSVNLIICTINRFPGIWKMTTQDILSQDPARLEKMPEKLIISSSSTTDDLKDIIAGVFKKSGWHPRKAESNDGELFGAQKGAWTRLGVIAVHASIIMIFIGAIIGSVLGFKASVNIPEGAAADRVFLFGSGRAIPLDFKVRCDRFSLTFYDDGPPKEYRSDLTVFDQGKEVLKKSIVVNDPLDYKGLTFYQSSYEGYNEYRVSIKNDGTKEEQQFLITPGKQFKWSEDVLFGIINMRGRGPNGGNSYKIWFNDGKTDPSVFWMSDGRTVKIERPDAVYDFTIKQRFATGLQVTKDPGVWFVYIGCGMMILGLFITFFLSHRRVWVYISKENSATRIILAGTANKNKLGFERDFENLANLLRQNKKLIPVEG